MLTRSEDSSLRYSILLYVDTYHMKIDAHKIIINVDIYHVILNVGLCIDVDLSTYLGFFIYILNFIHSNE